MTIRKKSPLLMAALLAAGVTVAGTAMARGGDCGHDPRGERADRVGMMKERHAERMSVHLDALAERLALRPDQRPVWSAFRESIASSRSRQEARGEHASTASAPERAHGMERAAEARLEHARTVRKATEALYAVLDADQRKVLDEQRRGPHEGRPGHDRQPHPPRS